MKRHWSVLLVLAGLSACSDDANKAAPVPQETTAPQLIKNPPLAEDDKWKENLAARARWPASRFATVKYPYPVKAAAIPKLKALLEGERRRFIHKLVAQAKEDARDEAWGEDTPPYRDEHSWKVVADLPGWLSLSDRQNLSSGGAHHNTNYYQILWDKAANRRRDPFDLFVSRTAFDDRFYGPLCDALKKARWGPSYAFEPPCADADDEVLVLGSSDGKHFDRVGILLGPYETGGGYAGGSFEVTLPMTNASLDVVKPEYRRFFAAGRAAVAVNVSNDR